MPRRDDLKTILILGSGPIVIGQGCEFDYSGTQACKALKAEGYRIVLVNSNPATIMTDPAFSDRTYIEPITPEAVRKIIEKECDQGEGIDAILPTLGGQTALNCACALHDDGTLKKHRIEMIGANREVIHRAEDREQFQRVCDRAGLKTPHARRVESLRQAMTFLDEIGLPAIIRPAFTLGGTGGGIAYNTEEYRELVARGLAASMITQVQVDQSLIGWKEFELEVVRDRNDNCIVICGIENIDPMGVHTGDSITVAPILTLTDKEYQALRDAAFAVMRGVGVETGGSNVQFAVNPNPTPDANGDRPFEFVVVEMNPRVSRSSALASKATGFPIAKIAARLAVGYSLDELRNDITGNTSACFEPTIDYVVTKMPRWTFEKFPEADETLTTQMKSVGEAMAIGRTFKESLQKVIRSMEVKRFGLGLDRNDRWLAHRSALRAEDPRGSTLECEHGKTAQRAVLPDDWPIDEDTLTRKIAVPCQGRLHFIRYALKLGWSIERIHELSRIDPFFIDQIAQLVEFEDTLCNYTSLEDVPRDTLFEAKQLGYSDAQLANLYLGAINSDTILKVREHRKSLGIEPVYKLVDTCAAEFEAATPYFYSTYEKPCEQIPPSVGSSGPPAADRSVASSADEARVSDTPKVIIIGGGPNRIGQGIEFDYCCVHAAMAAKELGFEAVMINSNPETVSTDYDTSDLLFFEPLTLEDTLNVIERLNGGPLRAGEQTTGSTDEVNPTTPETSEANLSRPSVASSLDRSVATPRLVHGVIVQFGGQTPLNLASGLVKAGVPIIGTSLDSIDLAEDRDRFDALLERLDLKRPASGIARSLQQAVTIATVIGYPVLVRPSYVLGGRGMEICHDEDALRSFMTTALDISDINDAPILIDKFIDGATEVDVDVVADFPVNEPSAQAESPPAPGIQHPVLAPGARSGPSRARTPSNKPFAQAEDSNPSSLRRFVTSSLPQSLICGIMEHIEQAGIHSGDSSCTIPPWSLSAEITDRIKDIARRLAAALKVNGLMNVQMAVKDDEIYIIEVNPRASRTVPFVGKAKHVSWASIAAKVMMGRTLDQLGAREIPDTGTFAIKESVFPFTKFPGVDVVLGPEMRSTGEVMGIDASLPIAFAKGQMSAGVALPREGGVFISVRDADKPHIADIARPLFEMGFSVYTTAGTAEVLQAAGLEPRVLEKIAAGARPNVIDLMSDGEIALVINTPTRTGWQTDEGKIRATAVRLNIPMITTATGALASVKAIEALRQGDWTVQAMQDYGAAVNVEPIKA